MKNLTAALMTLMGVRVVGVLPVDGTWEHGEPEHWTWLRLVEEDGRVVGDLSGTLKEAMTLDSSALPLHVARSWDDPYLDLELGGCYHMGETRTLPTTLRHCVIQFSDPSFLPLAGSSPSVFVTGSARLFQTSAGVLSRWIVMTAPRSELARH